MAKQLTRQQKRFKKAVKEAWATCHRDTDSKSSFDKCMSREMKKRLTKAKGKSRKRKR